MLEADPAAICSTAEPAEREMQVLDLRLISPTISAELAVRETQCCDTRGAGFGVSGAGRQRGGASPPPAAPPPPPAAALLAPALFFARLWGLLLANYHAHPPGRKKRPLAA